MLLSYQQRNKIMTTTTKKTYLAILPTERALNAVFAAKGIDFIFRTHYVNVTAGICGIEQLVKSILVKRGAVFASGTENGNLRAVAVAGAMFKSEIESEVRKAFGVNRYPETTLRVILGNSKFKSGQGPDNGIRQIQLTAREDASGRKPRAKYFIDSAFDSK